MLNISSTTAVSWPTPASAAVAPVSPVAAVQPVQAGGHEGKAQTGFGREGQPAPSQPSVAKRIGADGGAKATAEEPTRAAAGTPAPHDVAAQRQAQQEAAQVAEQQQAKDKKAVEHLQNVLSRMWEASAAVVDRALGIETSKSQEVPGSQSDTAPDLSAVTASMIPRKLPAERAATPTLEPLPWPLMPETADGGEAVDVVGDGVSPEAATVAEVVSYDEHGNGSPAPVEAGAIFSERV